MTYLVFAKYYNFSWAISIKNFKNTFKKRLLVFPYFLLNYFRLVTHKFSCFNILFSTNTLNTTTVDGLTSLLKCNDCKSWYQIETNI